MLKLESRPTDPVKLAKAVAVGVAVAVPLLMFVAPAIVQHDLQTLSAGDTVGIYSEDGPAGAVTVQAIGFDTATVTDQSGQTHTVPLSALQER